MLHSLERIYAFGYAFVLLLEAGRSSLDQSLCSDYGSRLALHEKIVFSNDIESRHCAFFMSSKVYHNLITGSD